MDIMSSAERRYIKIWIQNVIIQKNLNEKELLYPKGLTALNYACLITRTARLILMSCVEYDVIPGSIFPRFVNKISLLNIKN